MEFFGFRLETKKEIGLTFESKPIGWERLASRLVKDKVILDLKNGKRFLEIKGDVVIYKVFNLWKFVESVKKIYEKTGIECDLTILRHGIFSPSNSGELFSTYGHLHKKWVGEAYKVLKNDCLLILTEKSSQKTFVVFLKEGNSILIHPKFMHRLVSYKKDSLILSFVPQEAGHDYGIVKNKGFPFHIFYEEGKIKILRNRKYGKGKLKVIKRIRAKIDPVKLFKKEQGKIKEILENPKKYEKLYFMGSKN